MGHNCNLVFIGNQRIRLPQITNIFNGGFIFPCFSGNGYCSEKK
ncbi:hypothetical protein M23134_00074 [Microscilla marina ATCC 23134]|uniref:Uncharacterized protein n=1 Tax=Microscilla marina ATCC 23134 TaxID=313606 RepID=A1ZKV3_MICM2|nr:hypothetical protein M23134_00074 [Microscilla marina ATCC 23134]